ncbi:PilW family protein [Thioalkalivibrio sp. ALMg13-2]|uniref:PilW family protein n=1 Tax=Thioalkalivibrio sp. ALMg13-2 TaxID=1158167 RepID=UPI00036A9360|nr:PilW family protein [Thioalkalivibrio sp. ALMg13-2]
MNARQTKLSSGFPSIRGLTLVELMVAMLIGLLLVGGTISIFISTQQTYRTQEAMSRVQETGRFAIERIARDAREAGYGGCPGSVNNLLNEASGSFNSNLHDASQAFIDSDAPSDHLRGDILTVSSMGMVTGGPFEAAGGTQPAFQLAQGDQSQIRQGQILLVVDPTSGACEQFQNVPAQQGVINRGPGQNVAPGNVGPAGQVNYTDFQGPIDLLSLSSRTYYIATSADGSTPALYRRTTTSDGSGNASHQPAREIAAGVYDMRIEYGLDDNGDARVERYVASGDMTTGDWENAAAVRVHLLVNNGSEDNVVDEARSNLYFGGTLFDAPDRRLYQTFTTTIAARNLLE